MGNLITWLEGLDQGYIRFQGRDLHSLSSKDMRGVRKDLQIVFQQSRESLDRKRTIGQLLMDPISMYRGLRGQEARAEVARVLGLVACKKKTSLSSPLSCQGARSKGFVLPGQYPPSPSWSCWMNPPVPWISASRARSSTYSRTCSLAWD